MKSRRRYKREGRSSISRTVDTAKRSVGLMGNIGSPFCTLKGEEALRFFLQSRFVFSLSHHLKPSMV